MNVKKLHHESVKISFAQIARKFGEVNTPRKIIENRCADATELLKKAGLELFVTAPVSDNPQGKEAARIVAELKKNDFNVLIICIFTGRRATD